MSLQTGGERQAADITVQVTKLDAMQHKAEPKSPTAPCFFFFNICMVLT